MVYREVCIEVSGTTNVYTDPSSSLRTGFYEPDKRDGQRLGALGIETKILFENQKDCSG